MTVSVEDRGVGIPPENLDKVFDKFYRVIEDDHKTYPGLGFGLFLSAEIIRLHGGKIWAANNRAGGAKFSFSVPINHNDHG